MLWASTATAATVSGKVELKSRKLAAATVVYIENVKGKFKAPKEPQRLSQRGQKFRPPIVPVLLGSRVDMSNDDYVAHNIYSESEVHSFDLERQEASFPLPGAKPKEDENRKPPPDPVLTFNRLGMVDLHCNIHPKMYGVVLVLPNPYFTKPERDGTFEIKGVPPGKYTLKMHQANDGGDVERSVEIKVGKKGAKNVSL
jgi:plastocyanin